MKSEFYRQISNEHKTRKSTAKARPKKGQSPAEHINPLKFTKALKSANRGLIRSIDHRKNYKDSTDQHMMRISFSRPLIFQQDQKQAIVPQEKTVLSLCYECESLKSEHQRQLKEMRMHFEEQLTANTEKYIQMQKKYLFKDSEFIQLSSNYIDLLNSYHELQEKMASEMHELEEWRQKCQSLQEQLASLRSQIKRYQGQNEFFNHFLSAFVEQTKCMINWCGLFEKTCDELPAVINLIKEDLFFRKVDLDIMLKESIQYKKTNFGSDSFKQLNQQSFFFESEDSSSSFMKYLKQNVGDHRTKHSRMFPLTQIKHHTHDLDALEGNKQNFDIANRPSFEWLIQSRLNQKLQKQKHEKTNEQFLRILLVQAQTIESSGELKSITPINRSRCEVQRSLLSSFSESSHNDIY